jgi:hypothetical protein
MQDFITDMWRTHQLVGLIFISLCISYHIAKTYSVYAGLALAYTLISAVVLFQKNGSIWGELQPRIDATSANGFAIIASSVFFISIISSRGLENLYRLLEVVTIFNCCLVIYYGYGMFNAYSADNVFSALMAPVLWFRNTPSRNVFSWFYYAAKVFVPVTAMVMRAGTTCFITLAVVFLAYAIATGFVELIGLVLMAIAVGVWANMNSGLNFITPGGRFEEWTRLMKWWWENANMWFGTGTGSFEWLAPTEQVKQSASEVYLFMHNDYLQAIFEQGFVGFFLYGVLAVYCVKYSWRRPWLFAAFAGLAVIMLTFYPFRFIASELLILCFLREAHECKLNQSSTLL